MMILIAFVVGGIVGLGCGWCMGTWSENRLWLNAVCGREKIFRSVQRVAPKVGGDMSLEPEETVRSLATAPSFRRLVRELRLREEAKKKGTSHECGRKLPKVAPPERRD